jgi:hypothetical protein
MQKVLSRMMDKITEVRLAGKLQERRKKLTALAMLLLILGGLGTIPFFMFREKVVEEPPHYKTVPLATPFESVQSEPPISESTPAPINRWKQTPDTRLAPTPQPKHHASHD